MPYIKQDRRKSIDEVLDPLLDSIRHSQSLVEPGDLNYIITRLIQSYLVIKTNYTRINDVIGVLEAAKMELYRRTAAPYEDEKISKNGDVLPVRAHELEVGTRIIYHDEITTVVHREYPDPDHLRPEGCNIIHLRPKFSVDSDTKDDFTSITMECLDSIGFKVVGKE